MRRNGGSKKIGAGATSIVHYNLRTKVVSKRIIKLAHYDLFRREFYWLRYLNMKGYTWCPKLIGSVPRTKTINMEYCGEQISKKNAPTDWREQLEQILEDLKKENIKHNDIKHTEVLVKEGRLYLIDYGWSSRGNDWSCGQGFNSTRKPMHVFHDEKAIYRIERHLK